MLINLVTTKKQKKVNQNPKKQIVIPSLVYVRVRFQSRSSKSNKKKNVESVSDLVSPHVAWIKSVHFGHEKDEKKFS